MSLTCPSFEQMDGQKAFMAGKLRTKGNLMLATKLGGVLGVSQVLYRALAAPLMPVGQTAKAKAKL